MKLYFWSGLDTGREYADAFIGVIAHTQERAIKMVQSSEVHEQYRDEVEREQPETLEVTFREKERFFTWG